MSFRCPVCGKSLSVSEKTYLCPDGHSFDIASSGYVNLLMKQSSSKSHGDDLLMVKSRRLFLEKGYYSPLRDEIRNIFRSFVSKIILDSGCGEGYYTSALPYENNQCFGIDISKKACEYAAKKCKGVSIAVASCFSLPFSDDSIDAVLSIFSPLAAEEYFRVLKKDGILVRVIPLDNHLISLKKAVYDNVIPNPETNNLLDGFILKDYKELRYSIKLDNTEDILNLFSMTPYYYKTSEKDQKKLCNLDKLETEIEFGILIYEKACPD